MRRLRKIFFRAVAKYGLGKPEMGELLAARYGDTAGFLKTGINRLCYLARLKRLFAVTSVTLELSAYCNLACSICPVNRTMKREKGFMSFALVKKVLTENPGLSFVLLYHWGESLLHPELFRIIRFVKDKALKAFLTTNGVLLDPENVKELLESGLDRLTISMDGIAEGYERIRNFSYRKLEENILYLLAERERCGSPLKVDLDMTVTAENEDGVGDFREKWQGRVDMLRIHPLLYVGRRENFHSGSRCNEAWRGNLIVLWDGRVVPCCADYEGEMALGNVNSNSLQEIINSPQALSLRRSLLDANFPALCRNCAEYETKAVNPRFF